MPLREQRTSSNNEEEVQKLKKKSRQNSVTAVSDGQTTSPAMVMDLSTFQAGSQSTTSHLFARTRLFHRLTFIRPALMLKSRQVVWEGVAHITTISLGFWEWRYPKRGDAHITVTVTYKQVVYNETGHCKNLFLKSKYLLWLLHQIRSLQKADKLYSYSQFREHKRILKCYRFVQLTLFQFCLNITK